MHCCAHQYSLIGVQGPTNSCIAELIGGKEEMQEAVHLAFPSVPIEEDADPGHDALEEEDGEGPDEGQTDSLEVGDAPAVLFGPTAGAQQHSVTAVWFSNKGIVDMQTRMIASRSGINCLTVCGQCPFCISPWLLLFKFHGLPADCRKGAAM